MFLFIQTGILIEKMLYIYMEVMLYTRLKVKYLLFSFDEGNEILFFFKKCSTCVFLMLNQNLNVISRFVGRHVHVQARYIVHKILFLKWQLNLI